MSIQTLKKLLCVTQGWKWFRNNFFILKKPNQQFGVLEHFHSTFITKLFRFWALGAEAELEHRLV